MLVALALIGCSSITHSSDHRQPSNSNAAMDSESNKPIDGTVDARLVSANTTFGFKLFAEISRLSTVPSIGLLVSVSIAALLFEG